MMIRVKWQKHVQSGDLITREHKNYPVPGTGVNMKAGINKNYPVPGTGVKTGMKPK